VLGDLTIFKYVDGGYTIGVFAVMDSLNALAIIIAYSYCISKIAPQKIAPKKFPR